MPSAGVASRLYKFPLSSWNVLILSRKKPTISRANSRPNFSCRCSLYRQWNLYNLEATPAEGTTYRFAKEDKKRYTDIIQAGEGDNIYYTNSTQLPANFTDDAYEALDLQDELQSAYTGGTVFHLYMKERISSAKACKELVKEYNLKLQTPIHHDNAGL